MAAMAVLEQEIADLAIVEGDEPQPEAMLSRLDELLALLGSTDGPDVVRRHPSIENLTLAKVYE